MKFGVTEAQAKAFSQQWDSGGLKLILDSTSISFANAWANIALKSALENPDVQMAIFKHVYAKLKLTSEKTPAVPAPVEEKKSSIIITG